MLDADGATDYNEIEGIWHKAMSIAEADPSNYSCVIGSRNIN